ncbi:MAG: DNA ligase-1 [Lentimonas sp.]|jgi:DNA ligase-1
MIPKLIITFLSLLFLQFSTANSSPPPIALAKIYHSNINFNNYFVSEKLDGIRAYWDGKNLISKNGNIYNAPDWFTKNFPDQVFEGELWISKGKFEEVSGIVRRKIPHDGWKKVKLMIFDLPENKEIFSERLEIMKIMVQKSNSPYLKIIPQFKVKNHQELNKKLDEITKNGGEGLMLHRANSFYLAARSDDILKFKKFSDAEAKVLKYFPGKGKYQGMMGSILVENEEGIKFKIGGGFSDSERKNPPKIGAIVTYKFYGKTKNNKPKFASFLRIRDDYQFKIQKN